MDAVSCYLNDVLTPALLKHGVSYAFLTHTVKTVAMQMNSLLRHWDDRNFRNTVLLLGLEEGSYYEPAAKTEVRCFVVVTLRNSPFEVLQSDAYAETGLQKSLSNQEVKAITSAAVQYFSKQDFNAMCKYAKNAVSRDLYAELIVKYPVTWLALQKAAATTAKIIDYPKMKVSEPYKLEEFRGYAAPEMGSAHFEKALFDGYDPTIEQPLMDILCNIAKSDRNGIVTDSFKALTRNVDKLFRILEFLLTNGNSFTTSNFYLENGHVEKRIKPLRAGHSWGEMQRNMAQTDDLGYQHKRSLTAHMKQLSESDI